MTQRQFPEQRMLAARKLHPRFTPVVFAFYMSTIMAFLMTLLITAVNAGINEHYFSQVWQAYRVAMPCAFLCILMVRPLVARLVQLTIRSH
ncbi:DUF2798 domain-containing protein [Vreelandella populi]|uniref:DUF2798 domain-containing protein n=1 Tax=Vreelandella populi TaxID=2498858 RepID=A0A433LEB0_9GAMM|nr:DUF2798 domain-containing protein [Halomonas populi]RUR35447.1 DUF2798 domain-containing protein [Halomonas populi]RUR47636.1 DUF2798 domain-containing protein [Halomonas populi]RUR54500.1 DUF2798 domain-containing protein [Halomonas populi]